MRARHFRMSVPGLSLINAAALPLAQPAYCVAVQNAGLGAEGPAFPKSPTALTPDIGGVFEFPVRMASAGAVSNVRISDVRPAVCSARPGISVCVCW